MEKACWRMTEEERKIIDEIEMSYLIGKRWKFPQKIGKMIMKKLKESDGLYPVCLGLFGSKFY